MYLHFNITSEHCTHVVQERICLGVDLFHWDDAGEDLQRPHAGIILFEQDIVALENPYSKNLVHVRLKIDQSDPLSSW